MQGEIRFEDQLVVDGAVNTTSEHQRALATPVSRLGHLTLFRFTLPYLNLIGS